MDTNPKGFTIVELLIVIVIIAILAAIGFVAYNGIQYRSKTSALSSELTTMGKQIELYFAENDKYPTTSSSHNAQWRTFLANAADISDSSKKSFIICRTNAGDRYSIVVWQPLVPAVGESTYYIGSDAKAVRTLPWQGLATGQTVAGAACSLTMPGASGIWAHQL